MSKLWEIDPETKAKVREECPHMRWEVEADESALQLLDIQKQNGNNVCVDCGAPSPQWVCCDCLGSQDFLFSSLQLAYIGFA